MLKIGLTGGIGSGKSVVSQVFSQLGVPVYNADHMAKILVQTNHKLKKAIVAKFGEKSFTEQGYNTAYIAQLVFNNDNLLRALNKIIHPVVADDFINWCRQQGEKAYVLQEAAILFESRAADLMDYSIVVDAPLELRIERVITRDHCSKESVEMRIKNQWPADKIRALADWVIENDDKQLILPQILNIHKQLISISESHG